MQKACMFVFAYGDVKHQTVTCVTAEQTVTPLMLHYPAPDASIDRTRAQCACMFLAMAPDCDVMVMIDRDITFRQGDVEDIIEVCRETKGVVGALVSKKRKGQGYGSCIPFDAEIAIRTKQVIDMPEHTYVGGAFMAIHRECLMKVAPTLTPTALGWLPFFEPYSMPNTDREHVISLQHPDELHVDHLTEDWAFCARAREAGCSVSLSAWPLCGHVGEHVFTVFDGWYA